MPIRRPRISRIRAGGRLSMRAPSSRISPPAIRPGGSSRPMIASPVSDLPAPDSPTTPSTSPGAMSKETPSSATQRPLSRGEFDLEIADREQRAGHFSLGLSASRSQSPSRLTDRTRTASARLGNATIHHSPEKRKFWPMRISVPSDGWVGGRPTPRKDSVASVMIGEREIDRRDHQHRPHHVGQDMGQEDARVRKPDQPRRQHVIAVLFHHRRAAHGARILHPERQADRDDEHAERRLVAVRRLQQRVRDAIQQQGDQNGGKRELHVGDPHDHGVDPAAGISRDQAERDADRAAEQHAAEADRERNAEPVEDRRPDVAPLVVRAEQKARIAAGDEARRDPANRRGNWWPG